MNTEARLKKLETDMAEMLKTHAALVAANQQLQSALYEAVAAVAQQREFLQTRVLSIIDADGEEVALLTGADDKSRGIIVRHPGGKAALVLGRNSDGGYIGLNDSDGKTRIGMQIQDGAGVFQRRDAAGNVIAIGA